LFAKTTDQLSGFWTFRLLPRWEQSTNTRSLQGWEGGFIPACTLSLGLPMQAGINPPSQPCKLSHLSGALKIVFFEIPFRSSGFVSAVNSVNQ
jgi:hypothetical protein